MIVPKLLPLLVVVVATTSGVSAAPAGYSPEELKDIFEAKQSDEEDPIPVGYDGSFEGFCAFPPCDTNEEPDGLFRAFRDFLAYIDSLLRPPRRQLAEAAPAELHRGLTPAGYTPEELRDIFEAKQSDKDNNDYSYQIEDSYQLEDSLGLPNICDPMPCPAEEESRDRFPTTLHYSYDSVVAYLESLRAKPPRRLAPAAGYTPGEFRDILENEQSETSINFEDYFAASPRCSTDAFGNPVSCNEEESGDRFPTLHHYYSSVVAYLEALRAKPPRKLTPATPGDEAAAPAKHGNLRGLVPAEFDLRLYDPSNNNNVLSADQTMFNTILQPYIDSRNDLYANIPMTGGSAMYKELADRLDKEMVSLLPNTIEIP